MASLGAVSPRTRVWLAVGSIAAASVVAVVGATVFVSRGDDGNASPVTGPRPGAPPLALDLGVRSDGEAVALRRAETLYDSGRRAAATRIFARYTALNAQVGSAVASWPHGALPALRALARTHPDSALVRLHLGLVRFWVGDRAGAVAAWRQAARVDPDSESAVRAGDLLHPGMPRGLPIFVPSFGAPPGLGKLSPDRQLAALARAARRGGVHALLLYGVALERIGKPVSAERQYALAAAAAPHDAEAQVAAAVGRFDKDDPSRAFSGLGPLVKAFPHAPTVRFHLGLLLLWLGRVPAAEHQLRLARAEGPTTPLGREADRFLARLESIKAPSK